MNYFWEFELRSHFQDEDEDLDEDDRYYNHNDDQYEQSFIDDRKLLKLYLKYNQY